MHLIQKSHSKSNVLEDGDLNLYGLENHIWMLQQLKSLYEEISLPSSIATQGPMKGLSSLFKDSRSDTSRWQTPLDMACQFTYVTAQTIMFHEKTENELYPNRLYQLAQDVLRSLPTRDKRGAWLYEFDKFGAGKKAICLVAFHLYMHMLTARPHPTSQSASNGSTDVCKFSVEIFNTASSAFLLVAT
ncbi:hypothetical protein OIO90_004323 [Microbotryomycetes sp. JL221]|nr:hypothetical protein OIO90_004323 [Microbotryomycetes sp. JL221]